MLDDEIKCPKCGEVMYLIDHSAKTDNGICKVDAICENCLYVTKVTIPVAPKERNDNV